MGNFFKRLVAPVVRAWRGIKGTFEARVHDPILSLLHKPMGRITWGKLFLQTWKYMNEHELWLRASAIAFGSIVAGISSFVLLLTLVRYFVDFTGVGSELLTYLAPDHLTTVLRPFLPDVMLQWVVGEVTFLTGRQPIEILSASLVLTVWFASGINVTIISCLNKIYGVEETRSWFYLRRLGLRMTLLQLFTLFAGVIAMLDVERFLGWLDLPLLPAFVALALKWLIVSLVLMVSFAALFHIGPDSAQKKTWVTPGSMFGAVVFVICSLSFRSIVDHYGHYSAVYGSIAGMICLLSWLWLSSFVLLLAAELNRIIEYMNTCRSEGGELGDDGSCDDPVEGTPAKPVSKPLPDSATKPNSPPVDKADGR